MNKILSKKDNLEIEKTDVDVPIVSIVVPALNEELTIGEFVDWCKEGLEKAGFKNSQILIVDSSSDNTAGIAEQHGAEVLRVPKRGLGRAYIDAIPHIRGKYVIMGDCDLTYDFRKLIVFIEKFEQDFEFVMGSRYKGNIEPDAMPKLHQYFGTPFTTFILNIIYGTHYSDIHCGMRGITLDALKRMDLQSQSWEYASEMVLKASKMKLSITEVPVYFYKDREGRLSHHKRAGWYSAWIAGWINLKAMFVFAPDFFLMRPGIICFLLGLTLTISLIGGPFFLGPIGLNLHWMLLGVTLSTMGYSAIQFALTSQLYYQFDKTINNKISKFFSYNRGMLYSILLFATGLILNVVLLLTWLNRGFRLSNFYYPGIFGLLLMILGFQTFTFTLIVEMLRKNK